MILDTAERVLMREMQMRGEASFSRVRLEGLTQLGSTAVFEAALDALKAKGLVAEHRFSPSMPWEVSLTIAGRSLKIGSAELPAAGPP